MYEVVVIFLGQIWHFPRNSGYGGFEIAEFKSVIKIELVWFSKWGDFDLKLGPN